MPWMVIPRHLHMKTSTLKAAAGKSARESMALAVEFNGLMVPEWQDGYRIAFFPEDGVYDNEDCALTSAEGQGWHLYESAGGRWVKTVVRMEVISE
jgi:hypothetical protein